MHMKIHVPLPKEFGLIVTTPLLFPRGNKAFTGQFIQVKANQNMHIFLWKVFIAYFSLHIFHSKFVCVFEIPIWIINYAQIVLYFLEKSLWTSTYEISYIAFVVYKIKHNTFNDFGHHCLILQMVQGKTFTENWVSKQSFFVLILTTA